MAIATINVNAADAIRQVVCTVRMRGLRTAHIRLWLARQLIRLAVLVGGFRMAAIELEHEEVE